MQRFVILLLVGFVSPVLAHAQGAQTQGIRFEQGLSWSAVRAKAKSANKHIFMVLATTSCEPCAAMAQQVYPQPNVGGYLNAKFVAVKVQMDTTPRDNADVKRWYAEAGRIRQRYAVKAFPTYLIFSPEGKVVHRAEGLQDANQLLAFAADALNPAKQYYTLLERYQRGHRDVAAMRELALMAKAFGDTGLVQRIGDDYLTRLSETELYTKDHLDFIRRVTLRSTAPGFALFQRSGAKIDSVLGQAGTAQSVVDRIITNEEIRPSVAAAERGGPQPDWGRITATITRKYGAAAADLPVLRVKVKWYESRKDWPNYIASVVPLVEKEILTTTGIRAGTALWVNDLAWNVFLYSDDPAVVAKALDWSERAIKVSPGSAEIDTYANLLYKMGRTEEAIRWEEVAMKLDDEPESKTFSASIIDKMKKGEPVWTWLRELEERGRELEERRQP